MGIAEFDDGCICHGFTSLLRKEVAWCLPLQDAPIAQLLKIDLMDHFDKLDLSPVPAQAIRGNLPRRLSAS
jgi:hypothetical protein